MKRILITGKKSYVGDGFAAYAKKWSKEYSIDKISLRGETWRETSWRTYDTVLHVAGIAHTKAKERQQEQYYAINRDLTIEAAKKAKREGVRQFIFLSSMIVYGENDIAHPSIRITEATQPQPVGCYGDSKLQAEQKIRILEEETFKIAIVRPPLIYGKGVKGNFSRLVQLAKYTPVFPDIQNERSMIYMENLCEFLRQLVEAGTSGIYHPQNEEYVSTGKLVAAIAKAKGKRIWITPLLNPAVYFLQKHMNIANKVFGDFTYEKRMSVYGERSGKITFKNSIAYTIGKKDKEVNNEKNSNSSKS